MKELLYSLLHQGADKQTEFMSRPVPDGLFADCLPEWTWVSNYVEKHRRLPSWVAFRNRFKKVPRTAGEADDFEDLHRAATDSFLLDSMDALVSGARQQIQRGLEMRSVAEHFRQGAERLVLTDDPNSKVVDLTVGNSAWRRYRDRQQKKSNVFDPPSPWAKINRPLGFLERGEYVILVARPNIGKTWVLIFWAAFFVKLGYRVLLNSMEMPEEQIENRFWSIWCGLSFPRFRLGKLIPQQLRRWNRARISHRPPFFVLPRCNESGLGLHSLRAATRHFQPDIVMVDGAYQYASASKAREGVAQLTEVSRAFRDFSLTEGRLTFCTIQLGRQSEEEDGSTKVKGGLSSLYGADAWGQDADCIYALEGTRGGMFRELVALKTRESQLASTGIKFVLDPRPSFSATTLASDPDSSVYAELS